MALVLTEPGRRLLHGGADRVQATLDRLAAALPQPSDEESDFDDFVALGALWYYVLTDLMAQRDTVDLTELHRQAQTLAGLLTENPEV